MTADKKTYCGGNDRTGGALCGRGGGGVWGQPKPDQWKSGVTTGRSGGINGQELGQWWARGPSIAQLWPNAVWSLINNMGSLCDQKEACSALRPPGLEFESCVRRSMSSHSYHHFQEFLLAQFSLYAHKCGLKPHSFHFILCSLGLTFRLRIWGKWWVTLEGH